jgi:Protein of unknown function (DUF1593)
MNFKTLFISLLLLPLLHAKPQVWIYSDISDKTLKGGNKEGTLNDPDDISAMAGYLLMANQFDTLGIVVASTHRKEHANTPDQAVWASKYFGEAYAADRPGLEAKIGGYPKSIDFMQSCIKESSERFDPAKTYSDLSSYDTVQALLDAAARTQGPIYILCWGSLTEPAIAVNHCLAKGQKDLLKRLIFTAHWTDSPLNQGTPEHPENVANCREDAKACAYMKARALAGDIAYYECGAIGQTGIVSGAPKGKDYYDAYRSSRLGTAFVEGKYAFNSVDHSDSATYWVLLDGYGVSLKQIANNGTNSAEVEAINRDAFSAHSKKIHDELLRRSNAAAQP